MTEPAYELNKFEKCLKVSYIFLCDILETAFHIISNVMCIGLLLLCISSLFVYIYYIMNNNWNIFDKPSHDVNVFLLTYAKFGFLVVMAIEINIIIMCVEEIWEHCCLRNRFNNYEQISLNYVGTNYESIV